MQAAYYEATGPAHEVLRLGSLATPAPQAGEVRVRIVCSGVNPSDVKTRAGLRSKALAFSRIVPHSDGAGVVYGSGAAEVSLPFFPLILQQLRLRFFIVYQLEPGDRARAIRHLDALLRRGALQHQVAQRLPLARIAEAHALVESGQAVGNVVLDCGSA